ncbi:ATP-binding protein [Uliginosibacterium sp. H3]|uniref:histidine kinase n=1 Tax=Uliginosibacterium silvisoli TaxID=3114758 RepID=A0ABU6K5X0_9RHOO|nr:ATP-binding protein [Uliginosibacterium sp. H3]
MKSMISFLVHPRRRVWPVLLAWSLCCLLWGAWLVRTELQTTREDFETQSRILHRLLTQRAEQHEALFASLTALEPSLPQMPEALARSTLQSFIASIIASYPQVTAVQVWRFDAAGRQWAGDKGVPVAAALAGALSLAARDGQAVLPDAGGFTVLRRGNPSVWSLHVRADHLLGADEQPTPGVYLRLAPDAGPLLWERPASQQVWSQLAPLHFEKHLAVRSQPYLMTTEQAPLPAVLPWGRFVLGAVILLALCIASAWAIAQYRQRVLTQRQLALAHASRINAMGEVAAGMAHELNQPLAAVLSNVQAAVRWLQDDPPEVADAREAASAAAKQARRAGEILQRLRSFISPQASVREAVDLNAVLTSALSLVGESLQRRHVSVSSKLVDDLPSVSGERVAFEQVVVNLLLNAVDAMEAGGTLHRQIHVETSHTAERLLLSVRDSGPGLTDEIKARLFEPFFTTKSNGMGLGLSICENIVQQVGGDLSADNAEQGGAVFCMSLPRVTKNMKEAA